MTEREMSGRNKLREAMRICDLTYCDKFPSSNQEIHYSRKYLSKIEKLIQKSKNPIHQYFNTVGKCAAAVIAVAIISCSLMTVSAVREPIVEFFVHAYEKYIEIIYRSEDTEKVPETIETIYTIECIPQGYEIYRYHIQKCSTEIMWINAQNEKISLSQYTLNSIYTMDNENSGYRMINSRDMEILCSEKGGLKIFYWNTYEYSFEFVVPDTFSDEACLSMIGSVTVLKE